MLDPQVSPEEIKSREVVLDPQERPGDIKSREMELGSESWTTLCFSCSSTVALRTLSLWLCSTQLLKQQLAKYSSCLALAGSPPPTQVAWHWRGPHLLNTVIPTVADGLFGLYGSESADELFTCSSQPPNPPPLSPSLISLVASGDVKQHVYLLTYFGEENRSGQCFFLRATIRERTKMSLAQAVGRAGRTDRV